MRLSFFLIVALACSPIFACCVFDNDLLEDEIKPWPTVLETLSGRVERQRPEYYEARLAKALSNELPGDEAQNMLAAAVAYDHLNMQDDAIRLLRDFLTGKPSREMEQRANGQLVAAYLHLWWRGGSELHPPEVCLEEALKRVDNLPQSGIIRHILNWAAGDAKAQPKSLLPDMFGLRHAGNKIGITSNHQLRERGLESAAQVMLNLIDRHPAWENFDTYYALSLIWAVDGRQPLAHFARLRAWELREAGRKSRVPGVDEIENIRGVTVMHRLRGQALIETLPVEPVYQQRIADTFAAYRRYADRWSAARADHAPGVPADDPAFWATFEAPQPDLPPLPRPDPPQPAIETAEDTAAPAEENELAETGKQPWPWLAGLGVLMALGFFFQRRLGRKPPEQTD